jgi:branched-chain amino acid transport system substrate-binding protein
MDNGSQRHLAMLACDDTAADPASPQRPLQVARHLVDNLQVPAILGPADSKVAIQVITEVTTRADVLNMLPAATHPEIANFDRERRVWRTVPSDVVQVPALQALLYMIWSDLTARGWLSTERSAYVAREDNEGLALSLGFITGLPETDQPRGFLYDAEPGRVDWAAKADEIAGARPPLVFVFSSTEFVTELLPLIEQRWGDAPKPFYVLTKRALVPELLVQVEQNPDLGRRILGISPGARKSPLFEDFNTRFGLAFGKPGNLAEFAYDATYLLAYAIARSNVQRPTGIDLDEGMKSLSCTAGSSVQANPNTFVDGFRATARGGCVNFEGTSGPLDFDNDRGEALGDLGLWCADRDSSGKASFRVLDELYFDAKANKYMGVTGEILPFCWATP